MSSFLVSRRGLTILADGIDDAIKYGKIADFPIECEDLVEHFEGKDIEYIFEELNFLNAYALNYRYGDSIEQNTYFEGTEEIPEYTIDEYLKLLDCFLYQCCEGDTVEHELFKILSYVQLIIGNIVKRRGNPLYEEAPWG